MQLWLRHIFVCSLAFAGTVAGERAGAAFLPPQLELTMSVPEKQSPAPRETPRPEPADAVPAASASMTGVGLGTSVTSFVNQVIFSVDAEATDLGLFAFRFKLARERVELSQGFLLDILRPPRVGN